MTLGNRIKAIRGNISREKFAPQTSISKTTLVNYESDIRDPGAGYLYKLLELYPDVNPTWLLTGEGNMERDADRGTVSYVLRKEKQAEIEEGQRKYGIIPLDEGLMKRSLEGAWEFLATEKIPPSPELLFDVMMQRYEFVAMIKYSAAFLGQGKTFDDEPENK
jgi:transcriptional regulator with XRE-family HTH domain